MGYFISIRMDSEICLPFTNADCSSAMILGNRFLSLFARILKRIFIEVFIKLIGLKSVTRQGLTIFDLKPGTMNLCQGVVRLKNGRHLRFL